SSVAPHRGLLCARSLPSQSSSAFRFSFASNETSRLLGTDTLKPGDDGMHAARKILKESAGSISRFTIGSTIAPTESKKGGAKGAEVQRQPRHCGRGLRCTPYREGPPLYDAVPM